MVYGIKLVKSQIISLDLFGYEVGLTKGAIFCVF